MRTPHRSRRIPATTHWYAGYESQSDNILNVDAAVAGGETVDFWTWYFIEEGWDYGFVEALVGGEWVTVPLVNDAGTEVTTDDEPARQQRGGQRPHRHVGRRVLRRRPRVHPPDARRSPPGTTDVRFRYSTDAAYLDTGWFVDDVQRQRFRQRRVSSAEGDWFETTGVQDNNWIVQIVSPCDLTPGVTSAGETQDEAGFVYRFEGDDIQQAGFSTKCLNSTKASLLAVISNLPTGDLTFLDADYTFRLTNTGNKK